jgi:hypothetical protein
MIIAAAFAVAISSVAMATTPSKQGDKEFMVQGRVLNVDRDAHTLLVADRWSKKLYLMTMAEGSRIKITFGASSGLSSAEFKDVQKNNRIAARVKRTGGEHLATLKDGRQVIAVTVTE